MSVSLRRTAGAAVVGGLVWGSVEARCLRYRTRDIRLAGLPAELEGVTILHVSDVHAGHGPGLAMLERAAAWSEELRPDLDRAHRRPGDPCAWSAAPPEGSGRARGDRREWGRSRCSETTITATRPIRSRTAPASTSSRGSSSFPPSAAASSCGVARCRSSVSMPVGFPRRRYLDALTQLNREADLRVLLCHFPTVLDRIPPGAFQLVLAGHLHAGQICMPTLSGRVGLAHPRARYLDGLYQREGTLMHISPGLGTTFLPLRMFARPEATLLVLRPG